MKRCARRRYGADERRESETNDVDEGSRGTWTRVEPTSDIVAIEVRSDASP